MIFKVSIFLVTVMTTTSPSTASPVHIGQYLTVFNLNTWGLSWFDDEPIVSKDEPYDLKSVMDKFLQTMSDNYPNPKMIDMIRKVPQKHLTEMLNPARKKKERFEAICQHLKNNEFDVVFLQEVWFKQDYEFLKTCLSGTDYSFSNFDSECGTNPMSLVDCSGLVTMSRYQLFNETFAPLPKGELYKTFSKPEDLMLYAQFGIQRKVLIHEFFPDTVSSIRLVNTHFNPWDTFSALRERQAREVIRNLDTTAKYNLTILGMDLNDEPLQKSGDWTASYRVFKNANFSDGFNEEFDTYMDYPVTFAAETNSWTTKNPKTLDYIMILPHETETDGCSTLVQRAGFMDIEVQDLKTANGNSFSDHNSVNASIWM